MGMSILKNPLANREQAIHSACINNRSAVATRVNSFLSPGTLRCSLATIHTSPFIGDNMLKADGFDEAIIGMADDIATSGQSV